MGNSLQCYGSGRLSADFMGPEELIMVTRSDGKIMEFTAPFLVRDLMAAYPQHSVAHSKDAACRCLSPDKKLVPGQLYRLLLIPKSPSLSKDADISGAKSIYNNSLDQGRISREWHATTRPPSSRKSVQNGSGIIRVKMVISKEELAAMLSDRSVKEKSLLLHLQRKAQYVKEDYVTTRCIDDRWRPSLESILEVN